MLIKLPAKKIGGLAKLIFKAALDEPNLLKNESGNTANLMVVLHNFERGDRHAKCVGA